MHFDEFVIGQVFETKSIKISKEEIMKFAQEFDPQYMHIDEDKANQSRFKGIIASGLHTLSLSFKLWIELGKLGDNVIAGKGIKDIRFINPVYPDDVLFATVEVIDKKKRKENQGVITTVLTTYKNDGEKVLEAEMSVIVAC